MQQLNSQKEWIRVNDKILAYDFKQPAFQSRSTVPLNYNNGQILSPNNPLYSQKGPNQQNQANANQSPSVQMGGNFKQEKPIFTNSRLVQNETISRSSPQKRVNPTGHVYKNSAPQDQQWEEQELNHFNNVQSDDYSKVALAEKIEHAFVIIGKRLKEGHHPQQRTSDLMLNKDMEELLVELELLQQNQELLNQQNEALAMNQHQAHDLKKSTDDLSGYNRLLQQQNNELLQRMQQIEKEKFEIENSSTGNKSKVESLSQQLQRSQEQQKIAEDSVQEFKRQIIEEQKISESLKHKNNELLAKFENQKSAKDENEMIKNMLLERISDQDAKINQAAEVQLANESKIKESQAKFTKLQQRADDQQKKIDELMIQLAAKNDEIADKTLENEDLRQAKTEEVVRLEKEALVKDKQIAKLKEEKTRIQNDLNKKTQVIEKLGLGISDLFNKKEEVFVEQH